MCMANDGSYKFPHGVFQICATNTSLPRFRPATCCLSAYASGSSRTKSFVVTSTTRSRPKRCVVLTSTVSSITPASHSLPFLASILPAQSSAKRALNRLRQKRKIRPVVVLLHQRFLHFRVRPILLLLKVTSSHPFRARYDVLFPRHRRGNKRSYHKAMTHPLREEQ